MRKLNKAGEKVKFQILNLLETPMTASDIKEKLPGISSTGTILYHLKNLVKDEKIVREKQIKVRGQPTYYYLAYLKKKGIDNWRDLEDLQKKQRNNLLADLIQNFKEGMLLKDFEKIGEEMSKNYPDLNEDSSYDLIMNEKYFDLYVKITEEGKRFLQENSKKLENSSES